MKPSRAEQESIVLLMNRLYEELVALEETYDLRVGAPDFRPRIDYFHDAVRAYMQGVDSPRLAVERLSNDVQWLRYFAAMPLAAFVSGQEGAPHTSLVATAPALVASPKRPDRTARARISESYQRYGVFFAALLKTTADTDFYGRTDAHNGEVEEINAIIAQLQGLLQGKGNAKTLAMLADQLDDPKLRAKLASALRSGTLNSDAQHLIKRCIDARKNIDAAISQLDKAHLIYATTQLALYEGAKDMLKELAAQGLNMAGQFVRDAMNKTQRSMGR